MRSSKRGGAGSRPGPSSTNRTSSRTSNRTTNTNNNTITNSNNNNSSYSGKRPSTSPIADERGSKKSLTQMTSMSCSHDSIINQSNQSINQ